MTITPAATQPHKKPMPKLSNKITQARQLPWCLANQLRISMPQSITMTMSISLLSLVKATWPPSRIDKLKAIMKLTILGKRTINRYLTNPTVLASIRQWMEVGERRRLRLSTQQNWKLTTPDRVTIIKVSKSEPIIQIMRMSKKRKEAHRSKRTQGHKHTLLVTIQIRSRAICLSRHTPRMDLAAHFCQVQIRPH